MRHSTSFKAFTLVELLVVISIIAVLIAMLIPMLSSAREIVRFTMCKSNMKQAGTAWNGYATTHDGRFPGYAVSRVEHWGPTWSQLLNREWFHGNDPTYYPKGAEDDYPGPGPLIRFWAFGDQADYPNSALKNKYMTCPDYRAWASGSGTNMWWSRPWIANDHAVAGHYSNPYDTSWSDVSNPTDGFFQDGARVPDSKLPNDMYNSKYANSYAGTQCFYYLGRKVESWSNPTYKYLMWEAEAYNDMDRYNPSEGAAANGILRLNDDGAFAPWCAQGGHQAFRHMLPPDQNLWQSRARAPVLYVDGHVGEWSPSQPQYLDRNFSPAL